MAHDIQDLKICPAGGPVLPESAIRLDLSLHAYDYERALYTLFSRQLRLPEAGPAHSDAAPQGCRAGQGLKRFGAQAC